MSKEELVEVSDDDLIFSEVGAWAETKHRLVSLYSRLFSSGMKDKWDKRIYVELYAGSGHSRVRGTAKFIAGSPLRAIAVEHPFDKYIFCEEVPERLAALKARVRRAAPGALVSYIEGDCNERVTDILAEIPSGSKSETVLSLCFVDPFGIGIKFKTLRTMSSRFIDFLVLLAVYMGC